jgi:hypothetical protein
MMGGQRQFKTGTESNPWPRAVVGWIRALRRAQVRISGTEVAPKAALTDATAATSSANCRRDDLR